MHGGSRFGQNEHRANIHDMMGSTVQSQPGTMIQNQLTIADKIKQQKLLDEQMDLEKQQIPKPKVKKDKDNIQDRSQDTDGEKKQCVIF